MYAQFYNLVAEPFQLTPDHRFFFPSSVHNQALAHLTYGLNQGEGFIVITGDIGAGKTTLVAHLLSTLDSRKYVAAKVVTTQLGADDLLRSVVSAFGVKADPNSKSDMLRQLEAFFAFSHRSGKRCLLLIDEAQNLTPTALEELRMLSNFQVGERAPLQSFILGQPQFRAVLNTPELEQLRQRIIANYHLGPLDVAETQSYVEHRLQTAGWQNDPALAPDVFAAIHKHTEGVPRRINNLANRLLLYGFLEEKHQLDGSDVERVALDLTREENPDIRGKDLVGLPRDNRVTIVSDPGSVNDLRQRLDQIEQRQPVSVEARSVDELRRRLDLIEEYVRLRAMADRAFEDLVRRVSAMEALTANASAAAPSDVGDRLKALETEFKSLPRAVESAQVERLEADIARLGEQLGLRATADAEAATALAARLSALENVSPAAVADGGRLDAIEARLTAIADQIGKLDGQRSQGDAELMARCDALGQKIVEVAAAANAAGTKPGPAAMPALQDEFRALAERVKAVEQRKVAGIAGDGDALAALDARLRKVEKKPPAMEGLDTLQKRVASIEATQSAVDALTGTVTDLAARLERIDAMVRALPHNGAAPDIAPRLAAIEDAISNHQAMLKRAIGLAAGLLERNQSRELRDAS